MKTGAVELLYYQYHATTQRYSTNVQVRGLIAGLEVCKSTVVLACSTFCLLNECAFAHDGKKKQRGTFAHVFGML